MDILIGILLALFGLIVCFFGLRFWFILLPIFGGITGFYIGARGMQELFGTGFLSTATSWIVGIIVGIVLALLSWFIWYAGAIIMAGAVGASLFSGIFFVFWENPWGWLIFVASLIGAIIFALGALFLNLPIYIVIVNSALGGAALTIVGILAIFGQVETYELANGAVVTTLNEIQNQGAGWFWVLIWIVLSVLGILFQIRSMADVQLPEERWVQAQPA
jgi:hypothetical protein